MTTCRSDLQTYNNNNIMKSNKIYLVTSGEYSDYRVCAVFTTEPLAQKYIDSFSKKSSYSEFDIEEYSLDPFKFELKKDYKPYFLRMKEDGECTEIYIKNDAYGFQNDKEIGFDIRGNMHLSVYAKDEKHAIKIANEKRTQLIATNKWGFR